MGLFQFVDMTKDFYFSYSYDLTHSLQHNFIMSGDGKKSFPSSPSQEMFEWNHFQTEEMRMFNGTVMRLMLTLIAIDFLDNQMTYSHLTTLNLFADSCVHTHVCAPSLFFVSLSCLLTCLHSSLFISRFIPLSLSLSLSLSISLSLSLSIYLSLPLSPSIYLTFSFFLSLSLLLSFFLSSSTFPSHHLSLMPCLHLSSRTLIHCLLGAARDPRVLQAEALLSLRAGVGPDPHSETVQTLRRHQVTIINNHHITSRPSS